MVSGLLGVIFQGETEDLNKSRLRYDLLLILKANLPMNTAQICRVIKDRDRNDVDYCRAVPEKDVTESRLKKYGQWGYYDMCRFCEPNVIEVYRQLRVLESKGFVDSRLERRLDLQRPGNKDLMRMWSVIENRPNLKQFINLISLEEKT